MTRQADQHPRRLHPGGILLRIASDLPRTLLGIPATFAILRDSGTPMVIVALVLVALAAVVHSYVSWRAFSYHVQPDAIVITDGLLRRSRRSIPLDRVQDVSVEQKLLARLLGLATVRIETGGGEADEGRLDGVSLAEAERLRRLVRHQRQASAATDSEAADAEPEHRLFAMPSRRVLTLGLFRFSLVWIAVIFGALNTVDDLFGLDYDRIEDLYRIGRSQGARLLNPFSLAGVAGVAVLLGVATGVVRTLLAEYGFSLSGTPGRLKRVRGLLTRSEVVIAVSRVQLALIERRAISGLLGWRSLKLQTLGGSDDAGGRQEVAPLAREAELDPILAAAGLPTFDPQPLRPVAGAHVVRALIRLLPVPVLILLGSLVFPPLLAALVILPVLLAEALLARRYHRYALLPNSLQLTRGVLSRRGWIVPYPSVQVVRVRQGPLQRLLGVASVHVDTAGAGLMLAPRLIDVEADQAMNIAVDLLEKGSTQRV